MSPYNENTAFCQSFFLSREKKDKIQFILKLSIWISDTVVPQVLSKWSNFFFLVNQQPKKVFELEISQCNNMYLLIISQFCFKTFFAFHTKSHENWFNAAISTLLKNDNFCCQSLGKKILFHWNRIKCTYWNKYLSHSCWYGH